MPMFPTLTFRRCRPRGDPVPDLPRTYGARCRRGSRRSPRPGLARAARTYGACTVVGRDVARDGAALGEALSGLRATYHLVRGATPAFDAAEALSVAWSEATLEYLHDLSCEDPLTGLASLAHVRTRLDEIYRESELTDLGVARSHALVVGELRGAAMVLPGHQFTRALRLVQVAEALRSVFSGGQTLGRLGLTAPSPWSSGPRTSGCRWPAARLPRRPRPRLHRRPGLDRGAPGPATPPPGCSATSRADGDASLPTRHLLSGFTACRRSS